MAVGIVDALETIDIDKEAGHRHRITRRPLDFLAQPFVEIAAIGESGERVGHADLLQPLAVSDIVEAGRDDTREAFENIGRHANAEARRILAAEAQIARDLTARRQRQHDRAGRCRCIAEERHT